MTKQQYSDWKAFREKKGKPRGQELKMIAKIYSEVFNKKYWVPCGCNPKRYQEWVNKLNEHFLSIDQPE